MFVNLDNTIKVLIIDGDILYQNREIVSLVRKHMLRLIFFINDSLCNVVCPT